VAVARVFNPGDIRCSSLLDDALPTELVFFAPIAPFDDDVATAPVADPVDPSMPWALAGVPGNCAACLTCGMAGTSHWPGCVGWPAAALLCQTNPCLDVPRKSQKFWLSRARMTLARIETWRQSFDNSRRVICAFPITAKINRKTRRERPSHAHPRNSPSLFSPNSFLPSTAFFESGSIVCQRRCRPKRCSPSVPAKCTVRPT
jgi:hypothetical protein